MKKIISAAIIVVAIIGFAACGEPKPATSTSADSASLKNRVDTSTMEPAPAKPDTVQPH